MFIKNHKVLSILICTVVILIFPHNAYAKKKKLSIYGFIWKTDTLPGVGYQVALFDKRTNRLLGVKKSNFFGKYKFKNIKPGHYVVRVGTLSRDILITNRSANEHFHLGTKDGKVDFLAIAMKGSTAADVGPSDPQLMQWIAAEYYSYQSSTERKLMLCPNGIFYDSSESSYSGNFSDGGGNNTGGWGNASNDSGSGKWGIQGNQQSGTITFSYKNGNTNKANYRAIGDNCFIIDGVKYCYAGKPRCQ